MTAPRYPDAGTKEQEEAASSGPTEWQLEDAADAEQRSVDEALERDDPYFNQT